MINQISIPKELNTKTVFKIPYLNISIPAKALSFSLLYIYITLTINGIVIPELKPFFLGYAGLIFLISVLNHKVMKNKKNIQVLYYIFLDKLEEVKQLKRYMNNKEIFNYYTKGKR